MTKDIDDLIARLTVYADSDGKVIFPTFQRLCADAAAALRAQRDEIARLQKLEKQCWTSPEQWMAWCDIRVLERAERAEAERDALREVVKAAKRVRANTRIPGDTVTECKVPDCLCHSGADFDAALAKVEKEQGR